MSAGFRVLSFTRGKGLGRNLNGGRLQYRPQFTTILPVGTPKKGTGTPNFKNRPRILYRVRDIGLRVWALGFPSRVGLGFRALGSGLPYDPVADGMCYNSLMGDSPRVNYLSVIVF